MKLDRRTFLRFAGGAAAGSAAGGLSVRGMAKINELAFEEVIPPSGQERWIHSSCQGCAGGCGIRVRVVGDRAVKITGSELFPVNRGGLCPKGQAGLQLLYHPDRLRGPMRRVGPRGAGRFEPIGWEAAIDEAAGKLNDLRSAGRPEAAAVVSGTRSRGLMRRLWDRFLRVYGSPNHIRMTPPRAAAASAALSAAQGVDSPFAYDLDNTRYILSLEAPLLEGYEAPVWSMRALASLRTRVPRGRLVQADPRLSVTAARADEWIPVRPQSGAFLALGISYVIVRERLYDESFVKLRCFGFEDFEDEEGTRHQGFKNFLLSEYSMDLITEMTGVSSETILRVAREFARERPAVALCGSEDIYSQTCVLALNALVGSVEVPGGLVTRPEIPESAWPEIAQDAIALAGCRAARVDASEALPLIVDRPEALAAAIERETPYALGVLLLDDVNPVGDPVFGANAGEALGKVPYIVSTSCFMDESAAMADLILPNHTYLERWQDVPSPSVVPFPLYGIGQPVVPPLYDTRHTGDVVLNLARSLGGEIGRAFPWASFRDVLEQDVRALYDLRRGNIVATESEDAWGRLLGRTGWWAPSYGSPDDLWSQMTAKGGWWDPDYRYGEWGRVFRTPSKRFEFFSQTLVAQMKAQTQGEAAVGRHDRTFLPHVDAAETAPDEDFPLTLVEFGLLSFSQGRGAELPFLQESLATHVRNPWKNWVELHPRTASRLGIKDGDRVWVESSRDRVELRARVYDGVRADVVGVPAGLASKASARWSRETQERVGMRLDPNEAAPSLWEARRPVRVRVYKA